ncbi:hypothetical protein F5879DRAFT_349196 [Lentinula edodes]|nr:hypothetical protein F5879DRAFT_349196 [Lentinula edodes]
MVPLQFSILFLIVSLCPDFFVPVYASPINSSALYDRGLKYPVYPKLVYESGYDRVFLGYCYAEKSEVPKITHQAYGLRALVNSGRPKLISPGYWENQIGRFHYQNEMHKHNEHNNHGSLSLHSDSDSEHDEHKERKNYVEFKITVNVHAFSKLNFIYTSALLLDDASTINYLRSKGLDSDNTLILSPGPYVDTKPQYLNNLTFTFPPNVLLRQSSPTRKAYHRNPLQINAEPTDVEKATSNDFANWMKWPKKIIDLPPDIKPWLDFTMGP